MSNPIIPTSVREFEQEKNTWEKSPTVQGALGALRGAAVGAPVVGFANALRGGSPLLGGIAGALGLGILAGLYSATQQRVENIDREAGLRYYAEQLKGREPFFFMPPPRLLDKLLAAADVRRSSAQAGQALAAKRPPIRILHIPTEEG
jgi:hypothetical protein